MTKAELEKEVKLLKENLAEALATCRAFSEDWDKLSDEYKASQATERRLLTKNIALTDIIRGLTASLNSYARYLL